MLPRSSWRMSWIMTCLTVWAPMRPTTESGNFDALPGRGDGAGLAVELDGEFAGVFGVELLAQTGGDGLLDVVVDLVALDVFVASDAIDDSDQFLRIHDFTRYLPFLELIQFPTKKAGQTRRPAVSSDEPVEQTAPAVIRHTCRIGGLQSRRARSMRLLMQVHGWAHYRRHVSRLRFIPVSPGSKKWALRRSTYTVASVPACTPAWASSRPTTYRAKLYSCTRPYYCPAARSRSSDLHGATIRRPARKCKCSGRMPRTTSAGT